MYSENLEENHLYLNSERSMIKKQHLQSIIKREAVRQGIIHISDSDKRGSEISHKIYIIKIYML